MSIDIAANPYKQDFPLLAANPGLAFLDSAATAQRPAVALDAQRRFYEKMNANALRGLYRLSVDATEAIDEARAHVARFIGAADAREVVFCRNASEALNLVAKAFAPTVLEPGDEVCITIMEHHSNLIPWQQACRAAGARLVYLFPDEDGVIGEEELGAKIGPRTKIVAAAHVSNVLGIENPIESMAERVHAHGGFMVVDGAQSVPHLPVDVRKLGADFFAFSAHKALGPFGVGVLWGKLDLLEAMPPFLTGGEMISSVTQEGAVWAPVPEKFEAGTQDAAGIVATAAALGYLEGIGWDALQAREQALVRAAMERLAALPYIRIIGHPDPAQHHGAISFEVDGIHPHDVASILDEHDVAIRAGHHCAQPLLAWSRAAARRWRSTTTRATSTRSSTAWTAFGGPSMASIYTAALMEHNAHPDYKYQMDEPTCTHDGVNPSCGDELTLSLRLRGDRIEEAAFTGHGCAVSQAAADMMADLVTGETVGEARRLSGLYLDMIKGRPLTDEERADLDEAAELESIARMPARVKCAELAWRTLEKLLDQQLEKA